MSLGEGLYDTTCDEENPLLESVNFASSKNISLIAASGNNGNYTHISSPACLSNVVAVGATTKSSEIVSFSNRNSLTDLFAPGVYINSTFLNSTYAEKSGTSMSTPIVAASFAIMKQFFILRENQTKHSLEIKELLQQTGLSIYDSSSKFNFSQVDLLSAIISLDISPPNINLISPEDNSQILSNYSINQTFECNSSDDIQVRKMKFYLWNSTNLVYSSEINSSFINITLEIPLGNYSWNCHAEDYKENSSFAESNYSLYISQDFFYNTNIPIVNLISPSDDYESNSSNITFVYNLTFQPDNCSLFVNDLQNLTSNNLTEYENNFSQEFLEGNYSWFVQCSNSSTKVNSSKRNLFITLYNSSNLSFVNPSPSSTSSSGGGGGGGGSSSSTKKVTTPILQNDFSTIRNSSKIIINSSKEIINKSEDNLLKFKSPKLTGNSIVRGLSKNKFSVLVYLSIIFFTIILFFIQKKFRN